MLFFTLVVLAQYHHKEYASFETDPSSSYAKAMKKVFQYIADGKNDKAYEKYRDIINDSNKLDNKHPEYNNTQLSALYPLTSIAEAIFFVSIFEKEPKPNYDIVLSYQKIKDVVNCSSGTYNCCKMFLEKSHLDLDEWYVRIEQMVVDSTLQSKSEQSYDNILTLLWEKSNLIPKLRKEQENYVFEETLRKRTFVACSHYLDKYLEINDREHIIAIVHVRDSIALYSYAQTSQAMNSFIQKYPESDFLDKAKEFLEDYSFNEITENINSCRQFLKNFPNSKYKEKVNNRIERIAFKQAVSHNELEEYINFCRNYPNSEWFSIAEDSLKQRAREYYINENLSIQHIREHIQEKTVLGYPIFIPEVEMFYNQIIYSDYSNKDKDILDMFGGKVTENTLLSNGQTYNATYEFNDLGLIVREEDTQKRIHKGYDYGLIPGQGIYLRYEIDDQKIIEYTPTFSETNQLLFLNGSDGSAIIYEYDTPEAFIPKSKKIKNNLGTVIETSYFNNEGRKSSVTYATGTSIKYSYNNQGFTSGYVKKNQSGATESGLFIYTLDPNGRWSVRDQKSNNTIVVQKKRIYYTEKGEYDVDGLDAQLSYFASNAIFKSDDNYPNSALCKLLYKTLASSYDALHYSSSYRKIRGQYDAIHGDEDYYPGVQNYFWLFGDEENDFKMIRAFRYLKETSNSVWVVASCGYGHWGLTEEADFEFRTIYVNFVLESSKWVIDNIIFADEDPITSIPTEQNTSQYGARKFYSSKE